MSEQKDVVLTIWLDLDKKTQKGKQSRSHVNLTETEMRRCIGPLSDTNSSSQKVINSSCKAILTA